VGSRSDLALWRSVGILEEVEEEEEEEVEM
jgi:hypothetical protein